MKKRKYRRILTILVLLGIAVGCALGISASNDQTFHFSLQVDGGSEKKVSTGDIITVMFTLERTDSEMPYTQYAMQNEIVYDSTFFSFVEDSFFVKDTIVSNRVSADPFEERVYMNYLSLSGGTSWNAKTTIGSFQLRVTGKSGSARISNQNCSVSRADGSSSYAYTTQDILIVVSDECCITFDTRDGRSATSKNVHRNAAIPMPADPVRDGYLFTGWYTDRDCTIRWTGNTAEYNLRLYAGWKKDDGSGVGVLPFKDVTRKDWFYDSVQYVYTNGLMNGVTNTTFEPHTATSRAMLVTILWRMEGSPVVNYAMKFADVPQSQWYTEAIRWAASNGIVTGYSETKFGVNDSITREQMAAILWRYAKSKGYSIVDTANVDSYADAGKISSWAKDALRWACGCGLINGVDAARLAPQDTATRAQSATILMRFCEKYQ